MLPTSLVLLVCNMDRICLSVVMMAISKDFGWAEGTQASIMDRNNTVIQAAESLSPPLLDLLSLIRTQHVQLIVFYFDCQAAS